MSGASGATNGERLFAPVLERAAEVLGVSYLVFVAVPILWFAFVNFLCDEAMHPLDYYSNVLRTRPFFYILIFVFFGSLGSTAIIFDDVFGFVVGAFPELAVAMYLQGLVYVGTLVVYESAAAASAGAMLHTIANVATALIVTIPEFPIERPGVVYANAHLLVGIIGVLWVSEGVSRHVKRDGHPKLLSQGAECVPKRWATAVLYGNVALLGVLDSCFGVLWQIERRNYGTAITFTYSLVATMLLCGCCYSFRARTEVEDVEG